MASGSGQFSSDPSAVSTDDEEYQMPQNMAGTTPRRSDRAPCSLIMARLYLNSPPESPKNWGQVNLKLNDYHSNPMENITTFWIQDITDWWRTQEETQSKYTDHSNMACNKFLFIPHCVGVVPSLSLGSDVISRRHLKTTGETLRNKFIVILFAWAKNRISAGDNTTLGMTESENAFEMKRYAEERKLHRMAKVHEFLDM